MKYGSQIIPYSLSMEEIDYSLVPIRMLSKETLEKISVLLNSPKVLMTEDGLLRDWRGLAGLINIPGEIMPDVYNNNDPTTRILDMWSKETIDKANIGHLRQFLEMMDRFDVNDDTIELWEKDAQKYFTDRFDRTQINIPKFNVSSASSIDDHILTVDDLNGKRTSYDALVLYADEDVDFAVELILKMEECGFKLCVKDRDLIGGVTSEHSAILRLISERCNRLIVIVSPEFLQSPANTFFMNFAQALGIEKHQRKIIPCLYKPCQLPPQLSYYFLLDYQRSGRLWNFWDKLRESLKTASPSPAIMESQRPMITEMEHSISRLIPQAVNCSLKVPTSSQVKVPTIEITEIETTEREPLNNQTREISISMLDIRELENQIKNSGSLSDSNNTQDYSGNSADDSISNLSTILTKKRKEKKSWYRKLLPKLSVSGQDMSHTDGMEKKKCKKKNKWLRASAS